MHHMPTAGAGAHTAAGAFAAAVSPPTLPGVGSDAAATTSLSDVDEGFHHLQSCLSVAHTTVQKIRQLSRSRHVVVKEELRNLSFSLAAFDVVMHRFVSALLEHNGLPALHRNCNLLDAVQRLRQASASHVRPLPPGGIVSILYHFVSVLEDTQAALSHLEHNKLTSVWQVVKPLLVVAGVLALRRWRVAGMRGAVSSSVVSACVTVYLYRALNAKSRVAARLERCHSQLLILLRMWLVCSDVFHPNIAKDRSYALLTSESSADDYVEAMKPLGRLLLEETSLPQSATIWVHKSRHLSLLKWFLDALYAGFSKGYAMRSGQAPWLEWPVSVAATAYFALRPAAAAEATAQLFRDPDVHFVKRVWMLPQMPVFFFLVGLVMPPLTVNRSVAIDGIKCHVFADFAVPSRLWNEVGKLDVRAQASTDTPRRQPPPSPQPPSGRGVALQGVRAASPSPTPDAGAASNPFASPSRPPRPPPSLAVPALPQSPHGGGPAGRRRAGTALHSTLHPSALRSGDVPVLLYIHGGGWVGSSFPSDALMLSRWAQQSSVLFVFVHYSLSPEVTFPVALNECTAVYKWLRSHSSRVAVMGESAGGNLAAALTVKCVQEGVVPPAHLLLAYPALNLNHAPSTSRALHLADPCVPSHLLTRLAAAYLPPHLVGKVIDDPLLSPGLAPDDTLAQFPPTSIMVGGLDPLLDDATDATTRLRRVGVPVRLKVLRSLPHGFIAFNFLAGAGEAIDTLRQWCATALDAGTE